ncbi:MAG: oligosaccharide flippase family protein [Bacteroidota bacterium]
MKSSRTKLALLGFAADFGGQILMISVNFITVPIILQYTSQSLYGIWLTAASILGFLALTDFGIGVPLTRAIATTSESNNKIELNRIISTGFFALCFVGTIFLVFGMCISLFIGQWFNVSVEEQKMLIPAYLIAVTSASLALPSAIFGLILNGFQRMAIEHTIKNTVSIVGSIITIVLLSFGFGLMAISLSNLFIIVVSGSVSFIYAKRIFTDLSIRRKYFEIKELIKLLKYGGYFQIGRIANTVATSADNVIIASILGTSSVTPYSLTSKLPSLFSINLASKMPIAVFPAISQMFAENNIIKLQKVFIKLTTLSVRLAVMAATFVFIVNQQFVILWVGPNNYGGAILNSVFIYWILQDTIYRGTTALVFASGDLRNWTIASVMEAIFNIIISIFLAKSMGLVGVALGTSISKTLTTGISTPYFISKKLNMPFKVLLTKGIMKPFFISIPGVLIAWLISIILPANLGWIWILVVGIFVGISNIFLFEGRKNLFSSIPWKERIKNAVSFQME